MGDTARHPVPSMVLMMTRRQHGARRRNLGDRLSEIANLNGTHHLCPACKQMRHTNLAVLLTDKCTVT
jgi:hypothetical protein